MREVRDRYEIFLKVCETGNFTKAAEALNYTQSGISQMMAGLEEELGVQLFARAKKGGVLTDNEQRLIPYIREMVNQKEKLRQAAFNADALKACAPLSDPDKNPRTDAIKQSTV